MTTEFYYFGNTGVRLFIFEMSKTDEQ